MYEVPLTVIPFKYNTLVPTLYSMLEVLFISSFQYYAVRIFWIKLSSFVTNLADRRLIPKPLENISGHVIMSQLIYSVIFLIMTRRIFQKKKLRSLIVLFISLIFLLFI